MHVTKHSFFGLEPEFIFRAVETLNLQPTGELRQLNSFENRVFELKLEHPIPGTGDLDRVIVKFYRPGRWSADSLREEHGFLLELDREQIPVAPPLFFDGKTIHDFDGIYFTVFPKIFGRMPDEILPGEASSVGRLLAQVHSIGQQGLFKHRPRLGLTPMDGWQTLEELAPLIAAEVVGRYEAAATELIELFESEIDFSSYQRIHGDFHRGNLLANKDGFLLVDFDDCCEGPVMQDMWMILQGLEEEDQETLISGYEELREFPEEQLAWIPLLRGWRVMNYAAWIARRWEDPSFPALFPEFGTYTYWAEETEAIEAAVRSFDTRPSHS